MVKVGDLLSPTERYKSFLGEEFKNDLFKVSRVTKTKVYWQGPSLVEYGGEDGCPIKFLHEHMNIYPVSLENK